MGFDAEGDLMLPYHILSTGQDAAGQPAVSSQRQVGTWSLTAGLSLTKTVVWPGGGTTPPADPPTVVNVGCTFLPGDPASNLAAAKLAVSSLCRHLYHY